MRVTYAAMTALTLVFATAAVADDFPARKAGLWEVAVQGEGTPSVTLKMCIDADTDQLFHKYSGDIRAKHCSKNDLKVSGDTAVSESECLIGGTKITASSTTKFDGDSSYHTDIKTHFDPPKLGKSDVEVTQDAKWTGPCPVDMKPGDFDMGHGIKINIKTINIIKSLLPGHSGGQ